MKDFLLCGAEFVGIERCGIKFKSALSRDRELLFAFDSMFLKVCKL